MHGKIVIFSVDATFFHATVVIKNHSKDPQRNGDNHGTDIIYKTVLSAGFWLTVFYCFFSYGKSHVIAQCHCHCRIPVDILGHFNKIVGLVKNNMHQNNTYFFDEFLWAVCFQMKRAKKYLKKKFKMADIVQFG